MLRKIVGWIFDNEDTWEEAGRRMKSRFHNALKQFPIQEWTRTRTTRSSLQAGAVRKRTREKTKRNEATRGPTTVYLEILADCLSIRHCLVR